MKVDSNYLYSEIIKQENLLRDLLGDHSADIGSNNWVVSGLKTKTGMPLLANDPLAFTQPPGGMKFILKEAALMFLGLA